VTIRHSGGSSEMAGEVREGRLNLAFVALPGDGPPGVELIPLASEPIMLAVAAGHPLAKSGDVELQALLDATLVDLPAGWGIRMAVDRSFAAAGLTRTITYEVNDTATMVEFISTGLAIGLLPHRSSTPATTSPSCRSAITHHSSRRRSRSRPTADSAPPPARCSRRSSAAPAEARAIRGKWRVRVRPGTHNRGLSGGSPRPSG